MTNSILIHAPNWIGDQVLSYPFFYALRKLFPGAKIGVVARPWVAKIQFSNLVDQVFVQAGKRGEIVPELKAAGPWDLGFALPNSFSSAWVLRRAGVREIVGYKGDFRSLILQKSYSRSKHLHRSLEYLNLLRDFAPQNFDIQESRQEALRSFDPKASWASSEDITTPNGKFWILAPGSQAESRRWNQESFQTLARMIFEKTGMTGFILGGDSERALAHSLAADQKTGLVNYCAEIPLGELWRIFREARFAVTNDSGLAHMAALCGTKTHITWGAGDPLHTLPMGPGAVSLSQNKVPCWPCEKNECPKSGKDHLACLMGLNPDQVLANLEKLL